MGIPDHLICLLRNLYAGQESTVRTGHRTTKWSEVIQSYPTLCDPMDCSPPGSSVHGILQARILEWVAISFSRRSSQPRDQTQVSHIAGRCFNLWATREALTFYNILMQLLTQSCPTLCIPMDCSPPGFSIHGIFQATVLEWVAISFSRRSSQPRDWTWVSCIAGRHFTLTFLQKICLW